MFIVIEINGLKTLGDAECAQNQRHLVTNTAWTQAMHYQVTGTSVWHDAGDADAEAMYRYRYRCGDQYDNSMKHEKDLKRLKIGESDDL